MIGHRTPDLSEDVFGLHDDDFDGKVTSWLDETRFDLFGYAVWLIGIIDGVSFFPLFVIVINLK